MASTKLKFWRVEEALAKRLGILELPVEERTRASSELQIIVSSIYIELPT